MKNLYTKKISSFIVICKRKINLKKKRKKKKRQEHCGGGCISTEPQTCTTNLGNEC